MPKATIHFNYGPYMNSHGTTPKGRGSWAFEIEGKVTWTPSMTLADARTWMRAEVRKAGAVGLVEIDVLP